MAETPLTIVIKKKAHHGGHHGGAWKVAYADFVTAMMALFIVLWLLSASKEVQVAVGGYFKDPSGNTKQPGNNKDGADFVPVGKQEMRELKEQIMKSVHHMDPHDKLKNHIEVTITDEGLRIELMESEKGTFFELGSVQPTPALRELLQVLSAELGKLPNKISIEGHTDAKPYSQINTYDNWDLSSDRANAARRIMQDEGIRSDQISQVRGFAAQRLRLPTQPLDPSNRRISLIVQYQLVNGSEAPIAKQFMQSKAIAPQISEPAKAKK